LPYGGRTNYTHTLGPNNLGYLLLRSSSLEAPRHIRFDYFDASLQNTLHPLQSITPNAKFSMVAFLTIPPTFSVYTVKNILPMG
jgi:hypothetical protein